MHLKNSFKNVNLNKNSINSESLKLARPTSHKSMKSNDDMDELWNNLGGDLTQSPNVNESMISSSSSDLKESQSLKNINLNPFKIKVTTSRPTTGNQNNNNKLSNLINTKDKNNGDKENQMNMSSESF